MKRSNRRQIQDHLDKLFGPNSEALIAEYQRIAFGQASYEVTRPSKVDGLMITETVVPDFATRAHCLEVLIAYQHGRPRQQVEVTHNEAPRKWNPDLLSIEELEQFERLARKAQVAELPEGTVEGVFRKVD